MAGVDQYSAFSVISGIAAATMFQMKKELNLSDKQLRVAFDGDAVLFSDESEKIVKLHGLDTFFEHEKKYENKSLAKVNLMRTPLSKLSTVSRRN